MQQHDICNLTTISTIFLLIFQVRSLEAEGLDWMQPVQRVITRLENLVKQQSMEMYTIYDVSWGFN